MTTIAARYGGSGSVWSPLGGGRGLIVNTWTIIGIWVDGDPVALGAIEGAHTVYGGPGDDADVETWVTDVEASDGSSACDKAEEHMASCNQKG